MTGAARLPRFHLFGVTVDDHDADPLTARTCAIALPIPSVPPVTSAIRCPLTGALVSGAVPPIVDSTRSPRGDCGAIFQHHADKRDDEEYRFRIVPGEQRPELPVELYGQNRSGDRHDERQRRQQPSRREQAEHRITAKPMGAAKPGARGGKADTGWMTMPALAAAC